jgi:hypothetical protein
MQSADHRGFGQLFAQIFLDLARRQHAAPFEQLPDMCNQRRDAVRARCAGGALEVAIAAQRVNKGQGLGAHQKIRVIGWRAEQIERQRRIGLDQSRQQVLRALNRGAWRRCIGLTQARLDKRWSRCGNLGLARKKKTQADLG